MPFTVIATDYDYPSLEPEERILRSLVNPEVRATARLRSETQPLGA
jgi:hypothetical protein